MSIRLEENDSSTTTPADIESQFINNNNETYLYRIIRLLSKFKVLYIPITNWFIITFFISMLYELILNYNSMYESNVLLTTVIANVLLYGLSDILAQSISCFLAFFQMKLQNGASRSSSVSSIQLGNYHDNEDLLYTDYGDSNIQINHGHSNYNLNYKKLSKQTDKDVFNFYRFVGFMFWGFFMAFVQVCWYWILNHFYTQEPTFVSVLERVMSDQLVFSPISLFSFFSYSNFILERGNKFTLSEKIKKIYFSTLVANYMVWPLVQFINFLFMPKQFQVPFSSSIGVIWNCFLSMRNASN